MWIDLVILTMLAATAMIIIRQRKLFSVVMLTGIYSFLGAGWMLVLDAPDVAFTEAAVGAGIATVLFLGSLALTSHTAKRRSAKEDIVPVLAVILTGGVLIYGTLDMPYFGNADSPAQTHVAGWYIDNVEEDIDVPNYVTGILASYRGFDTLGETAVIFAAGIAVLLLLRSLRGVNLIRRARRSTLAEQSVLRVVAKLLIPYILLFGLYVQFHGDYGPGGGFQAGVIIGAAFILYAVIFGLGFAQLVIPPRFIEICIALGVLLYAGVGVATMFLGGNFLDYNALNPHHPTHGQHLGILLVELGVGLTVSAVMVSIFFSFAGRGRRR